jgi:hypothetical protein
MTTAEHLSDMSTRYPINGSAIHRNLMELSADDLPPYVECPVCGREVINSVYAPFTDLELDDDMFSMCRNGGEYCLECALELS